MRTYEASIQFLHGLHEIIFDNEQDLVFITYKLYL